MLLAVVILIASAALLFFGVKFINKYSSSAPIPTLTPIIALPTTPVATISASPLAFATLSLTKSAPGVLAVTLDTASKSVTGIQFQLAYDPHVLTSVKVTQGTFFDAALPLLTNVDATKGTILYAISIPSSGKPQTGSGIVAKITYVPAAGAKGPTTMKFLPGTKITALGITDSVLKQANDLTLSF